MGQQIRFFQLPISDITNPNVAVTITDTIAEDNGQSIANFMRNRNLTSAWLTTGSNDSANTVVLFNLVDSERVDSVFLVEHNLKSFKLEWFDGVTWSLIENVTNNELTTTEHKVGADGVKQVRLTIYGTMTANDDKRITQFNIVEEVGQLNGWPEISRVTHDLGQKSNRMLSGKYSISESVGAFSFDLTVDIETSQKDLDLYEKLFFLYRQGVMIYLSGGDESQFLLKTLGYRKQDFYFMKPTKDYSNDFYKSIYKSGVKLKISFVEVV